MTAYVGRGQLTLTDLNDVIASPTEPTNPSEGNLWFNQNDSSLYIYNNGEWVLASPELQIGGRNLVVNSTFNNGTTNWTGSYDVITPEDDKPTSSILRIVSTGYTSPRDAQAWSKEIPMSVNPSNVYTLSFDIRVDDLSVIADEDVIFSVRTFSLKNQTSSTDSTWERSIKKKEIADKITNGKWYRHSITFTPTISEYIRVSPFLTLNGVVCFREIKLEVGNTATDWTPAPEDVATSISDITETLGNMANDNILDYNERQIIKDKITNIIGYVISDSDSEMPTSSSLDQGTNSKGSFYSTRKTATMSGLSTDNEKYTTLESKYNSLKTYLDGLSPIKPWDISEENKSLYIQVDNEIFRTTWLDYYNAERDLANATADQLKKNVDDVTVGGTNYASNGNFVINLKNSLWSSSYVGNTVEVVDISTETPPFQFALHVNNTTKVNGGIYTPVLFEGEAAESLKDKEITVSFWLKYQNIVQGDADTFTAYFGRLIIEGEDASGNKTYSYPRVSLNTNTSGYDQVTGTNMTWTKYHATHRLSLPAGAVKLTKISFSHGMSSCTGEFWTTGIKIEIGNKVTDWSQSPSDLEERISKTEFKVLDDQIISTVTSSPAFSNAIDDQISNTSIGGRNLARNSNFTKELTYWRNWQNISGTRGIKDITDLSGFTKGFYYSATATGQYGYAQDNINVIQGESYILTAWFKVTSGSGKVMLQTGTQSDGWTSTSYDVDSVLGRWVRLKHMFTAKSSTVSIYLGQANTDQYNSAEVTGVQLEKGIIPTDWRLALEDTDERFVSNESKINQQADQISLVVSGTTIKGEEIASSIVTTPNAIKLISNNIDLTGKVSFTSFDSTIKNTLSSEGQAINKNPYFVDWSGTYPVGYYGASIGSGASFSKTNSTDQKGNILKYTIPSDGINAYLNPSDVTTSPYYQYITVQSTFMLESGSIDGAGVLMRYRATSNVDFKIPFKDLVPSPTLNKWYTVTKVIKQPTVPSGFIGYQVYPMGGWSPLGTLKAKTIYISEVIARPSTEQEIKAYESGLTIDEWKGSVIDGKTYINGGLIQTNTVDASVLKAGSVIADNITFTGQLKGATGTFSGKITSVNLDLQPDVSSWSGESVFRMFMGTGLNGGYNPGSIDFSAFGNSLTIAGSETNVLQYVYIYSNLSVYGDLYMDNHNIQNVNHLTFNDPGSGEGIEWLGGNGWRIVEAPDNMGNDKGNLQFAVGGGTANRRMTLDTDGNVYLYSASGNLMGSYHGSQIKILDKGGTWVNYYVKPADNGEVRVQGAYSEAYRPIRASSFPTGSSINYKTNLEKFEYEDAKYLLDNADIYTYHLISDVESGIYDKPKIGMIAEMVPQQLRDEDGVDPYSIVSALWRIVQQQQKTIEKQGIDIQDLMNAMAAENESNTTANTGGN